LAVEALLEQEKTVPQRVEDFKSKKPKKPEKDKLVAARRAKYALPWKSCSILSRQGLNKETIQLVWKDCEANNYGLRWFEFADGAVLLRLEFGLNQTVNGEYRVTNPVNLKSYLKNSEAFRHLDFDFEGKEFYYGSVDGSTQVIIIKKIFVNISLLFFFARERGITSWRSGDDCLVTAKLVNLVRVLTHKKKRFSISSCFFFLASTRSLPGFSPQFPRCLFQDCRQWRSRTD